MVTSLETAMRARSLTDAKLGAALNRSSQQICRIRNGTHKPSPELALAIERYFDGEITRHELRPDIYPVEQAA